MIGHVQDDARRTVDRGRRNGVGNPAGECRPQRDVPLHAVGRGSRPAAMSSIRVSGYDANSLERPDHSSTEQVIGGGGCETASPRSVQTGVRTPLAKCVCHRNALLIGE